MRASYSYRLRHSTNSQEIIPNCEQLEKLPPVDKVMAFKQKNRLELTMQKFKDEWKDAGMTYQLIIEQSGMVLSSFLLNFIL